MKDLADEQRRLDGHIGIFPWPTARPCLDRTPLGDCLLCKPDGKVAAPPKCGVVFRPIRYLVARFLEFMATVLAVFVRHGSTWTEISENNARGYTPMAIRRIIQQRPSYGQYQYSLCWQSLRVAFNVRECIGSTDIVSKQFILDHIHAFRLGQHTCFS